MGAVEEGKSAWSFWVEGRPRATPRPRCACRGGRAHIYDGGDKGLKAWRWLTTLTAKGGGVRFRAGQAVAVEVYFYVEGRRRVGDLDNLAKTILDSMTKAKVWNDDSQVTALKVKRRAARESMGREGARVVVALDAEPPWIEDVADKLDNTCPATFIEKLKTPAGFGALLSAAGLGPKGARK